MAPLPPRPPPHCPPAPAPPALQLHTQYQYLPGGPDESAHLSALCGRRSSVLATLHATSAKCVPRPQPSAYQPMQRDMRSFISDLGECGPDITCELGVGEGVLDLTSSVT